MVPPHLADPVLLIVLLSGAGLLQAYLIWRISRGPAILEGRSA